MRPILRFLGAILAVLVMAPSAAFAQAAITGLVKDSSGGDSARRHGRSRESGADRKVRSVATDGTGLYRIENLRPGMYAITFTLPGFNTFKRDGFELSAAPPSR